MRAQEPEKSVLRLVDCEQHVSAASFCVDPKSGAIFRVALLVETRVPLSNLCITVVDAQNFCLVVDLGTAILVMAAGLAVIYFVVE